VVERDSIGDARATGATKAKMRVEVFMMKALGWVVKKE
jgi:hypothetical protein